MDKFTRWLFSVAVMLSFLLIHYLVEAEDQIVIGDFSQGVNSKGVPDGWELKTKSGTATYDTVHADNQSAISLQSKNSSFALQKKVMVDLTQFPILSWQWKVTTLPKGGDFRKSTTDDQAAQLCLAFSKRKILVYLWSSIVPQDLMGNMTAIFFMTIKAVVVRTGTAELGTWMTETRNVSEDYEKLFGTREKKHIVAGVRLQINSQHTKSSAESSFANIKFMKQ